MSQRTIRPEVDDSAPGRDSTVDLGRKAARGGSVVYAGQITRIVLQTGSVVVLARLLSPSDYGLLAIVLAVVGVGEVFRDFGLSTAAVQARSLSQGQRSTLFWLNTGVGATLTLVLFIGSPVVAAIFHSPELTGIARALSFTFLLNGMSAQYRAHLLRELRFAATTGRDVAAQMVGVAVAIAAASLGAGYWALVAQQLVQGAVGFGVVALSARWLPRRPAALRTVRPMIQYGWNLAASQLVGYLNSNVDTLTVGVRFSPATLGLYSRGFQLLMKPLGQMRAPTSGVAVPILARLQDDRERCRRYVVLGQRMFGYTLIPVLAVVFAAAHPIVAIFLGHQWMSVAPIIAALACAGAFETLAYVGSWVYQARGLTPQLLRYSLVSLAIKVVCVVGGSQFGIVGVAIGYAMAPGLSWPLSLWRLGRLTSDVPTKQLWIGGARILGCAAAAGAAGRLVSDFTMHGHPLLQLVATAFAAALTYLLAFAVPAIRHDLRSVIMTAAKAVCR